MFGIPRQIGQAVRALWRAPGFTLTSIGTLGLAIGASAAIFALIDTVLIEPLPYREPENLVLIQGSAPGTDLGEEFNLATEFLLEYQRDADLLESVASYNLFTSTFRTDERVDRILMSSPSFSAFEMIGIEPALGRLPTLEDAANVALLSHSLWMDWFGGDPDVVGRSYSIAGETRAIIGVMPADFGFPRDDVLLWFPNPIALAVDLGLAEVTPGNFGLPLIARVKPGVERQQLIAQLDLIASRLPEQYGGSASYAEIIERFTPIVTPLEQVLASAARPLWILLGATSILVLIASANVANLFLARAARQRHDLAIRRSLGAPLGTLVFRQFAEAMAVAVLAGGLAILIAVWILPVIVAYLPITLPRLQSAEVSAATVLFTFGVSIAAGLICGLTPALKASLASLAWLRDKSRTVSKGRHRGREGLVIGQAALALLLLVGSGLLLRSFAALRDVDTGYDSEDIFTFQMAPEQSGLDDGVSWANFHLDFMERLRGLPGVETVGIVENFPLNEGTSTFGFAKLPVDSGAEATEYLLEATLTAGDYFEAMGIEVLGGRTFTDSEQTDNPGSIVVSRSAAERLWPGEDPIGKQLVFNVFGFEETVIGVVEDVRQNGLREDGGPDLYFPLVAQAPESWAISTPAYVLRTPRADAIAPEVRALVREVAPEAPMYRVFTIEALLAESMAQLTFTMIALALAAGLSLFLGMVGLYGILSSAVVERTRELGIRIALGADPQRLRWMVVVQGLKFVALGVLVGLIAAIVTVRVLESQLFGVEPLDAATLAATSLLMLLVGAAASFMPAYKASVVDPAETLAET